MEEIVRINKVSENKKNNYQITYPNALLKHMDIVIGISGTTTEQIEFQLKQPEGEVFAQLDIQHLNANGPNDMIGESKYP